MNTSGVYAQKTTSTLPKVFADVDHAKSERVNNLNQVRYIEMYLAASDPKTKEVVAAYYNSSVLPSDIPDNKYTSPQKLVEGLDLNKIKEEYKVVAASLNEPKLWMLDWIETEVGVS